MCPGIPGTGDRRKERAGKVNEGLTARRRRNESRTRGMTMLAGATERGFKTSTPRGKFTAGWIRRVIKHVVS